MSKRKKNSGMTIKVRRRTFNVSIRDNIDVDGNIYHTYRTFMTRSLLNGNKERLEITATTIDKLREKLSEIQMPYRMLEVDEHSNERVGDCYIRWFDQTKIKWADSSKIAYHSAGKRILRYFGDLTMSEFDENVISQFIEDRLEEGMSANRVAFIFSHLRNFCEYMELSYYLPYNPCDRVSIPKRKYIQKLALSSKDAIRYDREARNDTDGKDLSLMLMTGVRVGEVIPITESQVDRENHRLHVDRHIVRGENGETVEKSTKNTRSRYIPLTDEAIALIDEAIKMRDQRKEAAGDFWDNSEDGLIFTNSIGRRYTYDEVEKKCKEIAKKLCLNDVTTHTLRRTAATRFYYELGGDILTVSKILGHSSTNVTERYIVPSMTDYEGLAKKLSGEKDQNN